MAAGVRAGCGHPRNGFNGPQGQGIERCGLVWLSWGMECLVTQAAVAHKDGNSGTLSGESYKGVHSGCGGFPQW